MSFSEFRNYFCVWLAEREVEKKEARATSKVEEYGKEQILHSSIDLTSSHFPMIVHFTGDFKMSTICVRRQVQKHLIL